MTDVRDRARGALLGLAIGDALGAPFEFEIRDTFKCTDMIAGGPFNLKAGQWTDDTSMALCLADSLLEHPEFDAYDCMQRFVRWRTDGYNSSTGKFFDIGFGTSDALNNFVRAGEAERRSRKHWANPNSIGNGCIMRLAPVAIMHYRNLNDVSRIAMEQCLLTHSADVAETATLGMALQLALSISGKFTLDDQRSNLKDGFDKPRDKVDSDGRAVQTFHAALWSVANTDNFNDAVLTAVNLGNDSDTVAAVTGQIAGALYGASAIRHDWLLKLHDVDRIQNIADRLFDKIPDA